MACCYILLQNRVPKGGRSCADDFLICFVVLAIAGSPSAAPGKHLVEEELAKYFDEFRFVSTPTRNPSTGNVTVEFFLRLKGQK